MDYYMILENYCWEFPSGPVVRTRCFHCGGPGSILGRGTKIPQDVWHSQKKKKKELLLIFLVLMMDI